MESLYRPEALAAAARTGRSVPLHARQPGWTALLALVLPALLLGLVFLGRASFDEKLQGEGLLLPAGGLIALPAPRSGTLLAVHRRQGERVSAGSLLFELSPEAIDGSAAAEREERRRRLQAELEASGREAQLEHEAFLNRRAALQARAASLQQDLASLRRQGAIEQERLALAEAKLERIEPLAERGLLSALQLADQRSALLTQRAELQVQERQLGGVQRELQAAQAELQQLPADMERAASAQRTRLEELAQRASEIDRERASAVHAPVDGVLVNVLPQAGAWVASGQALASIAALDQDLHAEILVPAGAPALPRAGMAAVLRLAALPYQRHGHLSARVIEVSGAPLSPEQLRQAGHGQAPAQAMYRVLLALDGDTLQGLAAQLQPGMRIHADLLVARRSLVDALLMPLRGRGEPAPTAS